MTAYKLVQNNGDYNEWEKEIDISYSFNKAKLESLAIEFNEKSLKDAVIKAIHSIEFDNEMIVKKHNKELESYERVIKIMALRKTNNSSAAITFMEVTKPLMYTLIEVNKKSINDHVLPYEKQSVVEIDIED